MIKDITIHVNPICGAGDMVKDEIHVGIGRWDRTPGLGG